MKAIPDNVKEDPDFHAGYKEGFEAYAFAIRSARKRYGAPPPMILREDVC